MKQFVFYHLIIIFKLLAHIMRMSIIFVILFCLSSIHSDHSSTTKICYGGNTYKYIYPSMYILNCRRLSVHNNLHHFIVRDIWYLIK